MGESCCTEVSSEWPSRVSALALCEWCGGSPDQVDATHYWLSHLISLGDKKSMINLPITSSKIQGYNINSSHLTFASIRCCCMVESFLFPKPVRGRGGRGIHSSTHCKEKFRSGQTDTS